MVIRVVDESQLVTRIAKQKEHRCTSCGRKIPIGHRYWSRDAGEFREHTNCDLYRKEELLPDGFNKNRRPARK